MPVQPIVLFLDSLVEAINHVILTRPAFIEFMNLSLPYMDACDWEDCDCDGFCSASVVHSL